MTVYAYVERGKGKKIAEDSVLLGHSVLSGGYCEWTPEDEELCLAVSDGVGGNKGGAYASFFITGKLREADPAGFGGTEELKVCLEKVNKDLVEYGSEVPGCEFMAATLTGVNVSSSGIFLFHVGNTRAYAVNGQFLRQLTEDHTKVAAMVAMGMLSREEAAERPDANVINACFGNGDISYAKKLEVRDITEELGSSRPLLFTSDGIHDHLSQDQMEDILSGEGSEREKLTALAAAARENGSEDDISVVLFRRKG